jgi:hypothetical protein
MADQRIEGGMKRLVPAFLLALAACQGSAPPANSQKQAANPFEERLRALTEGERNAVFIRAIRDARLECQHVESSAPGEPVRGVPTWRARCDGGANYTIAILPGGTAQIVDDAEARLVDGNQAAPANGNGAR